MRALIFANGEFSGFDTSHSSQPDDLIIAADGGTLHCLALGIIPHVVVGDFDSLDPASISRLEEGGAKLVAYPARKDYTDLELAIQYAQKAGINDILVFGALGKRWDQTLANLLLPASSEFTGLSIRLFDGPQQLFLIRADQEVILKGSIGDIVSLVPLGGDATGITTCGLEYPLQRGTLKFGSTRGVSNVLVEQPATVRLEIGLLVCTIIHKNDGEKG